MATILQPQGAGRARERTMQTTSLRHGALAAAALLLAACGGEAESAEPEAAVPPPVQIAAVGSAVVDSALIEDGPVLSGTLAAERRAELRPLVGGTVLAVPVREGQAVGAGQLIAVIDTTVLADQATVFDYETGYFRVLSDFARTLATLERVVGEEVIR